MDFAPFAFRMPISFVLRIVIKVDNPIKPEQEMIIARNDAEAYRLSL